MAQIFILCNMIEQVAEWNLVDLEKTFGSFH